MLRTITIVENFLEVILLYFVSMNSFKYSYDLHEI